MLIHLQPEQVSQHWDIMAPHIARSLPPNMLGVDGMAAVLRAALLERLQVWVYEHEGTIVGILTTTLFIDPITRGRRLMIYSLSAISNIRKEMLDDGLNTLRKFAKSQGASVIWGFSNVESIVKYCKNNGAQTETRILEFPV